MKIKWNDYGIARREGNIIVLNKALKNHPEFMRMIIKHEKGHTTKGMMDFKHDLKDMFNVAARKEAFKFMKKEPRAYIQSAFPFWFENEEFYINPFLCFFYFLITVMFVIGWFL